MMSLNPKYESNENWRLLFLLLGSSVLWRKITWPRWWVIWQSLVSPTHLELSCRASISSTSTISLGSCLLLSGDWQTFSVLCNLLFSLLNPPTRRLLCFQREKRHRARTTQCHTLPRSSIVHSFASAVTSLSLSIHVQGSLLNTYFSAFSFDHFLTSWSFIQSFILLNLYLAYHPLFCFYVVYIFLCIPHHTVVEQSLRMSVLPKRPYAFWGDHVFSLLACS